MWLVEVSVIISVYSSSFTCMTETFYTSLLLNPVDDFIFLQSSVAWVEIYCHCSFCGALFPTSDWRLFNEHLWNGSLLWSLRKKENFFIVQSTAWLYQSWGCHGFQFMFAMSYFSNLLNIMIIFLLLPSFFYCPVHF